MVFILEPVKSGDIPSITIIQWSALQNNPLIQTLYPRGPTPSLTDFTIISYQKSIQYPSVRLVKAVDPDSGVVVAFAKWIVFRKDEQESEEAVDGNQDQQRTRPNGGWNKTKKSSEPPDCYTRALKEWNGLMTRTRRGIMGNQRHSCASEPTHSLSCYFACYDKNLMVLDILHTHPAHQGKGAGAQLVKWGTDFADEEGLQCYVEASPRSLSLLESFGFEDITEISMNLGAFRAGQSEYKHTVMLRPPYGSKQLNRLSQAPDIPPKGDGRPTINLMDADPDWVEVTSEKSGANEMDDVSSESASDTDEREGRGGGLRPPSMGYTAEARTLHMRSSSSTGSPRLESVKSPIRSSSSMKNVRTSAHLQDMRSSVSTRSF